MEKYNVGDEVMVTGFIGQVVKVELYQGKTWYHIKADGLNTADVEGEYLCSANNGGNNGRPESPANGETERERDHREFLEEAERFKRTGSPIKRD